MAATDILFILQSGKSVSAHVPASAAVGDYLPVSKVGPANVKSPDEFRLDGKEDDIITDIHFGSPVGAVELMNNDNPTGRIFYAQTCQTANAGRQRFNVRLQAGCTYRLRVVQGFPA